MSRRRKFSWFRSCVFLSCACGFAGAGVFLLWASTLTIPDLRSFEERRVSQSTKIYDRTGTILLYDVHRDTKRTVVPFEDISRNIKNATIAIEDAEFYDHIGIKPRSIVRATLVNVREGNFSQGGSTITQQVIKNSLLSSDKTITRKFKEWILALKLERVLDKERILALYLNETPYGGSIYGIEEASRAFFAKNAQNLSVAEAAYLAALPQAPTYYSPYGNHRDDLEKRKNLVLQKMHEKNFIDRGEYDGAVKETVVFQPQSERGILAPHFVLYVRELLEKKYGRAAIEGGGFKVISTLDYTLQQKAEEIVRRKALENEVSFNAENAALTAVDPNTGEILVMVGSRDYFDPEIDGNFNISLAHRQPGSAFKPFVYATAFKKGYRPETVVFDVSTEFSTACTTTSVPLYSDAECYRPENYDEKFRGPVSLRDALAQSINIPAVKVLYLSGLADSLRTARDFGITSLSDIGRYGLTLVLGGGEVSLLEMTSAYGVFASGGIRSPHEAILRVEDSNGVVVSVFEPKPIRVMEENVALMVSDILADNVARTPAFGEASGLYFPGYDVAAKTGTTNDYRDAWILGYTPSIAVGAWAGNNNNTPMEKRVAGFIVAPLWNEFMQFALTQKTHVPFKKPLVADTSGLKPILRGVWQGGAAYTVDRLSGKVATVYTPQELQEEHVVRDVHSILFWVDKNDPLGPKPVRPESDGQFRLWEYAVQVWVARSGLSGFQGGSVPTETDDVHTGTSLPLLSLVGVQESYHPDHEIRFSTATSGPYPLARVDIYINGLFVGSVDKEPFLFIKRVGSIQNIGVKNQIRVVATDSASNKSELVKMFSVAE